MTPPDLTDRIYALTGHTADLSEALDQWEHEQELVKDLYANYDLYRIHNTQLIMLAKLAKKIIGTMEKEAGLFLSEKSRNAISGFSAQMERMVKLIPELEEK